MADMTAPGRSATVHATTIAVDGRGVMIAGPSGAGKSGLALQLIALGARLVADDRTFLLRQGSAIIASAPSSIAGLIEARGVGLLQLTPQDTAPVDLVVDLGLRETARLPALHKCDILGLSRICLHDPATTHFPAAILLYMKATRKEPQ